MLQEANPEGSQALEGLIHGYLGVRMHTYTEILFFFSFLSFYFFFFSWCCSNILLPVSCLPRLAYFNSLKNTTLCLT